MSDDTEGVMFTLNDAKRIDKAVAAHERSVMSGTNANGGKSPPQMFWYWGKIATGSTLIAGTLEVPSGCVVDVWVPDGSGSDPSPFEVTTDPDLIGMTVINRSAFAGPADTMVKIEYGWDEWSIKWADC